MPTYYLNASTGNNANAGTSPAAAWQTLAHASTQLQNGDTLLLEEGQTFAGSLTLTGRDGVTIGVRWVNGAAAKATIAAGSGHGVFLTNCTNWRVQDLACVGSGRLSNSGCGILALVATGTYASGSVQIAGGAVRRCTATGFGGVTAQAVPRGCGIYVGGDGYVNYSGYNGIQIEDCDAWDNQHLGIYVSGWSQNGSPHANANVTVRRSRAWSNTGVAAFLTNHTGSGILIEDAHGVLVEECQAWDNGAECDSNSGPVGIWFAAVRAGVMRRSESYANQTRSGKDGGGFDLDGGCDDCTIEYCYSHDNPGPGFLVYLYPDAPRPYLSGNTVRYCISARDAQNPGQASIVVCGDAAVSGLNNTVYGCTVYRQDSRTETSACCLSLARGTNTRAFNNLLISTGTTRLIDASNNTSLTVAGNAYWRTSTAAWRHNGTDYSTFAAWRTASGLEAGTGTTADPQLVSMTTVPTATDAADVGLVPQGYRLGASSPLATAGVDLRPLVTLPATDYFGAAIPTSGTFTAVGAGAVAGQAAGVTIVHDWQARRTSAPAGGWSTLQAGVRGTSGAASAFADAGGYDLRTRGRWVADGSVSAWSATVAVTGALPAPPVVAGLSRRRRAVAASSGRRRR